MYCSVVEPDRAPGQCKIRILDTTKNPNTDLLLAKEYMALCQHSSVNTSKENMLYVLQGCQVRTRANGKKWIRIRPNNRIHNPALLPSKI